MITVRGLSRALLCLATALCVAAPVGLGPLAGRVSASTDTPLTLPVESSDQAAAPDLVIEDITWEPETPSVNERVTFVVSVGNTGSAEAPLWNVVTCYVDGMSLGSDNVNTIAPGVSRTATFRWEALPGAHTIRAVVACSNEVSEARTDNNEMTVVYSGTLFSDLVVEDISWIPLKPSVGDTVTFSVRFANIGEGNAHGYFKVLWLVDDGSQRRETISDLAAGATGTESFTWYCGSGGPYTVTAVVDEENVIPESDETNNEMVVAMSGVQLPDLAVDRIAYSPPSPSIGDDVTFTVGIRNNGPGRAGGFQVYYFVDDMGYGYDAVSGLHPGATDEFTFTWPAVEGAHTVKVVVDYEEEVPELDEANNKRTLTFSGVALPDLVVDGISWVPAEPEEGDTVTCTVAVKNAGDGKAADSSVYYFIDGEEVGFDSVGAVAPGATVTESFTWVVEAGRHIIRAVADYEEVVPEAEEGNNDRTVTFSKDTPPPPPVDASVYLYGQKTVVGVGEEIILSLSAVNLVTKPDMTVQLILRVPSGMSVTSTEFVKGGAGQYTTSYSIAPGDIRQIEVHIMTNQAGEFIVTGDILYYFGGDQSTEERATVDLPVTVHDQSPSEAAPRQEPGIGCTRRSEGMTMTSMVELATVGALTGLCWVSVRGCRGIRGRRRRSKEGER